MTVSAYAMALTLPRRLRVDGALSGAVLPAEVEGVAMHMHLPRIAAHPGREGSCPEAFEALLERAVGPGNWGTVVVAQLDPWRVCSFDLQRLGIIVPAAGVDMVSSWSGQELLLWSEQVVDWIEVLTGQVNDPRVRRIQQPVWGKGLLRWARDRNGWRAEGSSLTVDCSVPSSDRMWGRAASAHEFATALDRSSAGVRPMTRDRLLRDAHVHLLAGDARRSALDSGLAAEMMLASACRSAVEAGARWPLKRPPLEKAMLGFLVKAAPALSVDLPATFTQGLVDTRNDAAHGREVDTKAANDLLDATINLRSVLAPDWRLEVDEFVTA